MRSKIRLAGEGCRGIYSPRPAAAPLPMQAFIDRIDLYPEKQKDGNWIRNITLAFPVPVNGKKLKELSLETGTTVETVVLLSNSEVGRNDNLPKSEDPRQPQCPPEAV